MILQTLTRYYQRLAEDDNCDIAPYGFSRQKIAFCITLNPDGSLHSIDDLREQQKARRISRSLIVCGNAKPSGSGINPGFLWDNPAYMLGYKAEDPKPERTRDSFEAFRQRHLAVENAVSDDAFSAVCRFLKGWSPDQATQHQQLIDIDGGFGAFRIRAADHFIHERPAITRWWNSHLADDRAQDGQTDGQCLVTGDVGPLARLHDPKIKGVRDAQSSGAAIVSFNLNAFESYGREQSLNSPVGETATFQYCTVLNYLLREGSPQRIQIGDATTVFWTEKPSPAENVLPWIFESNNQPEDDALKTQVGAVLNQVRRGGYPPELGEPDTPFYVLGLSPNAARISVRFWYESTLRELTENLHRHFDDLQLACRGREPDFPAIWQLLRETVRDSKDLPPLLGGAVFRAMLMGTPYPDMLLTATIRRVRADRDVRYLRAAIIKACLNRNSRFGIDHLQKELPMALDPDRSEPAYQLGRLFAELEKTQEEAFSSDRGEVMINTTIKDRYFGAASTTPGSVFPRLIRLSQHHLSKLDGPKRIYRENRIREIADRLQHFPAHMNLRSQGLFALGYYHQRQ